MKVQTADRGRGRRLPVTRKTRAAMITNTIRTGVAICSDVSAPGRHGGMQGYRPTRGRRLPPKGLKEAVDPHNFPRRGQDRAGQDNLRHPHDRASLFTPRLYTYEARGS